MFLNLDAIHQFFVIALLLARQLASLSASKLARPKASQLDEKLVGMFAAL
ncbi:hypothetical protein [Aeoliella sp.]